MRSLLSWEIENRNFMWKRIGGKRMADMPVSSPASKHIDDEELAMHKLYRERIVQEDTLINHRMTWFFASQSFLVLAWAALYKNAEHISVISIFIDAIGIWFARNSSISTNAAREEIDMIDREYRSLFRCYQNRPIILKKEVIAGAIETNQNGIFYRNSPYLPALLGGGRRHDRGHAVTKRSHIIVTLVWCIAILAYCYQIIPLLSPILDRLKFPITI